MSLKRTKLYRDDTGEIFTFDDIKGKYSYHHKYEEEPTSEEVEEFIFENLAQNGGNIEVLTDENDEVLKWCNDYAEFMEADRHLSQGEKDESIKEIYYAISVADSNSLSSVILSLVESDEGVELLKRMKRLLND